MENNTENCSQTSQVDKMQPVNTNATTGLLATRIKYYDEEVDESLLRLTAELDNITCSEFVSGYIWFHSHGSSWRGPRVSESGSLFEIMPIGARHRYWTSLKRDCRLLKLESGFYACDACFSSDSGACSNFPECEELAKDINLIIKRNRLVHKRPLVSGLPKKVLDIIYSTTRTLVTDVGSFEPYARGYVDRLTGIFQLDCAQSSVDKFFLINLSFQNIMFPTTPFTFQFTLNVFSLGTLVASGVLPVLTFATNPPNAWNFKYYASFGQIQEWDTMELAPIGLFDPTGLDYASIDISTLGVTQAAVQDVRIVAGYGSQYPLWTSEYAQQSQVPFPGEQPIAKEEIKPISKRATNNAAEQRACVYLGRDVKGNFTAETLSANKRWCETAPTLAAVRNIISTRIKGQWGDTLIYYFDGDEGYAKYLEAVHNKLMHTINGNTDMEQITRNFREDAENVEELMRILQQAREEAAEPANGDEDSQQMILDNAMQVVQTMSEDVVESYDRTVQRIVSDMLILDTNIVFVIAIQDEISELFDKFKHMIHEYRVLHVEKTKLVGVDFKEVTPAKLASRNKGSRPTGSNGERAKPTVDDVIIVERKSETPEQKMQNVIRRITTRLRNNKDQQHYYFATTEFKSLDFLDLLANTLWGNGWRLKPVHTVAQHIVDHRLDGSRKWMYTLIDTSPSFRNIEDRDVFIPYIIEDITGESCEYDAVVAAKRNKTIHALNGNTHYSSMDELKEAKDYDHWMSIDAKFDWDFSLHKFVSKTNFGGLPITTQQYDQSLIWTGQTQLMNNTLTDAGTTWLPIAFAKPRNTYDDDDDEIVVQLPLQMFVIDSSITMPPNLDYTAKGTLWRTQFVNISPSWPKPDQCDNSGFNLETQVLMSQLPVPEGLSLIAPMTKLCLIHDFLLLAEYNSVNNLPVVPMDILDKEVRIRTDITRISFTDEGLINPDGNDRWVVAGARVFPRYPQTSGSISFHVTARTLEQATWDNTLVIPQSLFSSTNNGALISLFVAIMVEWPWCPMKFSLGVDTSTLGNPAFFNYVFNGSSAWISGLRNVNLLISSRGGFRIPGSQNEANSIPFWAPQSGPITSGAIPNDSPLNVSWQANNIITYPLVDYLVTWSTSWSTIIVSQLFKLLAGILPISNDLKFARDLAAAIIYKPLVRTQLSSSTGSFPQLPIPLGDISGLRYEDLPPLSQQYDFFGSMSQSSIPASTLPLVDDWSTSMAIPYTSVRGLAKVFVQQMKVISQEPLNNLEPHWWLTDLRCMHAGILTSFRIHLPINIYSRYTGLSCLQWNNVFMSGASSIIPEFRQMQLEWVSSSSTANVLNLSYMHDLMKALYVASTLSKPSSYKISGVDIYLWTFPRIAALTACQYVDSQAYTIATVFVPSTLSDLVMQIWAESLPQALTALIPRAGTKGLTGLVDQTDQATFLGFTKVDGAGFRQSTLSNRYAVDFLDMPRIEDRTIWNDKLAPWFGADWGGIIAFDNTPLIAPNHFSCDWIDYGPNHLRTPMDTPNVSRIIVDLTTFLKISNNGVIGYGVVAANSLMLLRDICLGKTTATFDTPLISNYSQVGQPIISAKVTVSSSYKNATIKRTVIGNMDMKDVKKELPNSSPAGDSEVEKAVV